MKLRYTLVLGLLGLISSYLLRDPVFAFVTIFGGCVLFSLRSIEYQLGDLKGKIQDGIITERDVLLANAMKQPNLDLISRTHEIFDDTKRKAG